MKRGDRAYRRSVAREHETRNGKPKRKLSSRQAAVARARGWVVYRCEICGAHHSATPLPKGKGAA